VTHLRTTHSTSVIKALLIPYSLHTIPDFHHLATAELEYLVFEYGSELQGIPCSGFAGSGLRSLFFPPTLRCIGPMAFSNCRAIAYMAFGRQCSLRRLTREVFSVTIYIRAITIPSSVKRIDDAAFQSCPRLVTVQFELPSQCWCISTMAFRDCSLLEPITVPASVEFIEAQHLSRVDTYPDSFASCPRLGNHFHFPLYWRK
jgi:hypothetical protein